MKRTSPETSERPFRAWRPLRLLFQIPAALVLAVVGLLLLVQIVVASPWFMRQVLDRVLPLVGEKIGAEIRVGSFSLTFLPLRVRIRDAVFTGRGGDPDWPPFSGAESIEARLSLLDLLGGVIHVERVQVRGGWNYLFIRDGLENLPQFPKSGKPKRAKRPPTEFSFPLVVDRVILEDARFTLEMPRIDLRIEAEGIGGETFCDLFTGRRAGADLAISSVNFSLGRIDQHVDRVEVRGGFSFRDFSAFAEHVRLVAEEVTLEAQGRIWDLVADSGLRMDFGAELEGELSAVNRLFTPTPRLSGAAKIRAELDAHLPDLRVRGTIAMDEGMANDLVLSDLAAAFDLDLAHVVLERLSLRAAGGTLSAAAAVDWKNASAVEGTVELAGVDIARALRGYGVPLPGVSGTVSGSAHAVYRYKEPDPLAASADLRLRGATYRLASGPPVVRPLDLSIRARARTAGRSIRLEPAEITAPHSAVIFNGAIAFDGGMEGEIAFDSQDLADFSPVLATPLSGVLAAQATLGGTFASPRVESTIRADDLAYGPRRIKRLEGKILLDGDRLAFDGLAVQTGETILMAGGALRFAKDLEMELGLHCQDGRLEDLATLSGATLDLSGALDVDLEVRGPLRRLDGSGRIRVTDAAAYGETFRRLDLQLAARDGVLEIRRGTIRKAGGRIQVAGTVDPFGDRMDLSISAEKLYLGDIDHVGGTFPLSAALEAEGTVRGALSNPEADAQIALRDVAYSGLLFGDVIVGAHLADRKLMAQMDALEGQLTGQAEFALAGAMNLSADLTIADLDLSILRGFSGAIREIEGVLAGNVAVSGGLAEPRSLAIRADIPRLAVRQGALDVRNERPLRVAYEDGRLRLEDAHLAGRGFDLVLYHPEDAAPETLGARARMDLALVQDFTDAIAEAKGEVTLDIRLPGDLSPAGLAGTLTLAGGELDLLNFPQPIEAIGLSVAVRNGVVVVENLAARTGGGSLTGGGEVVLDGFKPRTYSLFVKGEKIGTGYDPYLEATIGRMEMLLTGGEGPAELSGDVFLDRAVYTRDIDWRAILDAFSTRVQGARLYQADTASPSVSFNIAVHVPRNLKFESNLADIEMSGDLIVTGNDRRYGVVGSIVVLEGTATVLKAEYDVTTGLIQFFDETRIYPVFDITAETTVRDVFITVNAAGNPDSLRTIFSSDPPRSTQEILSLLTLGVDYTETQEKTPEAAAGPGESGQQGAETEAALQQAGYTAAAQFLGGPLTTAASRYAGIEIGVDTSTGVTRIQVSKELGKDLHLYYFQPVVGNNLEAQLQYDFFQFMSLLATWENREVSEQEQAAQAFGGGVKFRLEFQ